MISLNNVGVEFGGRIILDDVSLRIDPGEFVFLVGQTGSGKSTLLRLLYMDILPTRGTVSVGRFSSHKIQRDEIPHLRRTLGIVFQDFRIMEDRSVEENVAFTLHVTGTRGADIRKKVMMALGDVGLSHARNKMTHELSGGELQRVAIARALVNHPHYLLADEPTGNLDPETSREILQLLQAINTRGTAVIMATHNYALVSKGAGRILRVEQGSITQVDSVP
jgi:cell division transport system ATP-binding protein